MPDATERYITLIDQICRSMLVFTASLQYDDVSLSVLRQLDIVQQTLIDMTPPLTCRAVHDDLLELFAWWLVFIRELRVTYVFDEQAVQRTSVTHAVSMRIQGIRHDIKRL